MDVALPQSLRADQSARSIETDFRQWLGFWRVMTADDLTVYEKQNIALLNTFGFLPEDAEGAMREALWFYLCGRKPRGEPGGETLLDWDQDWLLLWADFRLYTGIDLDTCRLHWWKFMALFDSLPKDSGIKRRISIRAVNLGEIKDHKMREEYRRMKEAVALDGVEEDWDGFYERIKE